jgi:nitrous oxide reductase accessory protein NosL
MLISTQKGTGQIVSTTAETRFYDDVACLAADWKHHTDGARAFVRIDDERWSDATAASYAKAGAARTAMGSGIAAFADAPHARVADDEGRALTFADVIPLVGGAR